MRSKPDQIASEFLLHGCMAVHSLGVSWSFFSPLDGSRSIWFFFSPHCAFEWWNVKEWFLTAKLYEHHATGIYIGLNLILHFTERVNRQAKCGANYRRAFISNCTVTFSRFHFSLGWQRMGDRMGHCSWHQSQHMLILYWIIFSKKHYCWIFARKKKNWMEQKGTSEFLTSHQKPRGLLTSLNCTKKDIELHIKSIQIFRIQQSCGQ